MGASRPGESRDGSPWKNDSVGDAGGDRGGGDGGAGGEDGGRRGFAGLKPRGFAGDARGGCFAVGHVGARGLLADAGGSGAGFDGATMGRVARHVPGDVAFAGDFLTGDGRGGGKVVGQTWRRFTCFLRGLAAGASLASVAQDSSDAVERASSWCVLPVSHDSASLPASWASGTGDAARGVDSRDTIFMGRPGSPGAESCESRPTISASGLRCGGAGGA